MEIGEVNQYLLGIFFGAGFYKADYEGEHSPKVWVNHRQNEYRDEHNNGGLLFLHNVANLIEFRFRVKVHRKFPWNEEIMKYTMIIRDEKLRQWCVSNGVKSMHNKKYERIPAFKNHSHFIRGFFESGAGRIWRKPNDSWAIEFRHKSNHLLEDIRDAMAEELDIKLDNKIHLNDSDPLRSKYILRLSSQNKLQTILEWIYSDYQIYLQNQKPIYPYYLYQLEEVNEFFNMQRIKADYKAFKKNHSSTEYDIGNIFAIPSSVSGMGAKDLLSL